MCCSYSTEVHRIVIIQFYLWAVQARLLSYAVTHASRCV